MGAQMLDPKEYTSLLRLRRAASRLRSQMAPPVVPSSGWGPSPKKRGGSAISSSPSAYRRACKPRAPKGHLTSEDRELREAIRAVSEFCFGGVLPARQHDSVSPWRACLALLEAAHHSKNLCPSATHS
jgi:hypothetical protein